jgi:hypothetical protein
VRNTDVDYSHTLWCCTCHRRQPLPQCRPRTLIEVSGCAATEISGGDQRRDQKREVGIGSVERLWVAASNVDTTNAWWKWSRKQNFIHFHFHFLFSFLFSAASFINLVGRWTLIPAPAPLSYSSERYCTAGALLPPPTTLPSVSSPK